MSQIYEGMFLLDNQVVRESWDTAKTAVTGTLAKYGGEVLSSRRWDERRLAYPIQGRLRATYLLTYYRISGESIPAMRRDFDLSERVLRYLILAVDGVPDGERELSLVEDASDFSVPAPPADDAPDPEPDPQPEAEPKAAAPATTDAPSEQSEGSTEGSTEVSTEASADAPTDAPTETVAAAASDAASDAGADAGAETRADAPAGTEAESTAPAEGAQESTTPEEA